MTTGRDLRGTQLGPPNTDALKLWVGNLRKDLKYEDFAEWLSGEHINVKRPIHLVRWRCKRAEEVISFTECPYPIPPSPQLLQYVLFGNGRGTAETPASRE